MNRISIGLAACIVATVTVGCGAVTASQPVTDGHTTAATRSPANSGPASPRPASTGAPSGCQSAAPGSLLLITLAGNGKAFCMRLGEQVAVQLRGTSSSWWQVPLASSTVLRPVPHGEMSLVAGLTEEWFAGARPGQVLITSIRLPCPISKAWQGRLEQTFPLPTAYPLRACVPVQRFSVSIVVVS